MRFRAFLLVLVAMSARAALLPPVQKVLMPAAVAEVWALGVDPASRSVSGATTLWLATPTGGYSAEERGGVWSPFKARLPMDRRLEAHLYRAIGTYAGSLRPDLDGTFFLYHEARAGFALKGFGAEPYYNVWPISIKPSWIQGLAVSPPRSDNPQRFDLYLSVQNDGGLLDYSGVMLPADTETGAGATPRPTPFDLTGSGLKQSGGSLAFGPDGMINMYDGAQGYLLRFDPKTHKLVRTFRVQGAHVMSVPLAITANGLIFAAPDPTIGIVYDYATGQQRASFAGATALTHDDLGYVYAHSRNARWVQIYDTHSLH